MADQLTDADVSRLFAQRRYAEIEQARQEGRLALVLGGTPPPDPTAQLTEADIHRLWRDRNHAAIERARKSGQLAELLGHTDPTGDTPDAA